jgi:hypothetical protein
MPTVAGRTVEMPGAPPIVYFHESSWKRKLVAFLGFLLVQAKNCHPNMTCKWLEVLLRRGEMLGVRNTATRPACSVGRGSRWPHQRPHPRRLEHTSRGARPLGYAAQPQKRWRAHRQRPGAGTDDTAKALAGPFFGHSDHWCRINACPAD